MLTLIRSPAFLAKTLFATLLLSYMVCFAENKTSSSNFKIYDATIFSDKPDISQFNIGYIKIIYPNEIWIDGGSNKMPPSNSILKESAERVLKKIDNTVEFICLDIESWPVVGDIKSVTINKMYFIDTIKRYKAAMPGKKIGLYGVLPIRNYYDAINQDSPGYFKWKSSVENLADIAREVDVVFPSLYTFTTNQDEWVKYAESNIRAAKQFNKPVIPLIWPQYHQSNKVVGLEPIPADFWRLQLETIAANADGVIIWGGWDTKNRKRYKWDDNAEWWTTTKNFVVNQ